jgi:isopentenyl-diphosphate Delta-isomerase
MTDMATFPALPGEHVILVDCDDVPVGVRAKQDAHVEGLLHRAFSIFVFDTRGRMLLQRRATGKYHSGGLWSNTCCSHPRPGESTMAAAQRRLFEEMGFNCPLITACSFVYRADVGGGLIEHEYDHVFVGHFDGDPAPDPAEVEDWRWLGVEQLTREVRGRPDRFTYWFHIAWRELQERGLVRR